MCIFYIEIEKNNVTEAWDICDNYYIPILDSNC